MEGAVKIDIFSVSVVNRNQSTGLLAGGAGGIHFRRAFESPKGGAALWAAEPTKKDTTYVVSFFVVRAWGLEPQRREAREPKGAVTSVTNRDYTPA